VGAKEGRKFGLHRLLDQPLRARAQDFSERVVDFVFLAEGNNFILGHGVTLLLGGSGRLDTNPVTPPSSHRHPDSAIAHRHEALDRKDPYNRACLAAILGDEKGCRERLLRAKEFGTLPKVEHLKSDPDLETMRDKPWFKELISG
jgi:hypothetical protein